MKQYQIDAFATKIFEGNPACVIYLETWLDDALMQNIAMENNQAETAFFVPKEDHFHIRWFTPTKEVDLCGHATLAAAYVAIEILKFDSAKVVFDSRSGKLEVFKSCLMYELNFPVSHPQEVANDPIFEAALGVKPTAVYGAQDYIVMIESEEALKRITPNLEKLATLDRRGVMVSAPSESYDFVLRFFAPKYGIDEDHVTGSAYTQVAPLWEQKLGQRSFQVRQHSKRGGDLLLKLEGDRIRIAGMCQHFSTSELFLADLF